MAVPLHACTCHSGRENRTHPSLKALGSKTGARVADSGLERLMALPSIGGAWPRVSGFILLSLALRGRGRIGYMSRASSCSCSNNLAIHTAGKARPKLLHVSGACGAFIALVKLGWNRRVRIRCNQRCDSFRTPPRKY